MNQNRKTLLIFALPGTGKTTWVKTINKYVSIDHRPVIDFDYRAPRRANKEVKVAQSELLNAWARSGIKAITTFPQFLDFGALDAKLFKIVFVMPIPDDIRCLYDRVQRRNPESVEFLRDYDMKICQYWQDWYNIYESLRPQFDVEWRMFDRTEYLSDVLDFVDFSPCVRSSSTLGTQKPNGRPGSY
jgi:hypothetical protein